MSEIKDTLRKIHTLSVEGSTEGERAAAKTQLDRLLTKYQLTLSEVIDEQAELFKFEWKNETEKRLLLQVLSKVLDRRGFSVYGSKKKEGWFYLTKAEYAETAFLYSEYKRALDNDFEIFFQAFIQSNNLFMSSQEESDDQEKELTPEEKEQIFKVLQMANGMTPAPIKHKRLGQGN